MALIDVDFNEGEGRDFLVEIAAGALATPVDTLVEESGGQFSVQELPLPTGGDGDIFIIND